MKRTRALHAATALSTKVYMQRNRGVDTEATAGPLQTRAMPWKRPARRFLVAAGCGLGEA